MIIDYALVIFTSRFNENVLFERKHFRFLVGKRNSRQGLSFPKVLTLFESSFPGIKKITSKEKFVFIAPDVQL